MKRITYKKIRLYPTTFNLHVFLYPETIQQLRASMYKNLPKNNWDVYLSTVNESDTAFVESVELDTEGKTIIMIIKDPTPQILVHEIVHVLNHLSQYTGIEVGPEAQEWNAYFQDYLYGEISPLLRT